jgi:hypothetical protein
MRIVAGLAARLSEEQEVAVPQSTIAFSVSKLICGVHAQPFGKQGYAIGIPLIEGMAVLLEENGGITAMTHTGFVNLPGIVPQF